MGGGEAGSSKYPHSPPPPNTRDSQEVLGGGRTEAERPPSLLQSKLHLQTWGVSLARPCRNFGEDESFEERRGTLEREEGKRRGELHVSFPHLSPK